MTTNNQELIEGNYWHDNFWGVCSCQNCKMLLAQKGKIATNYLGKILMKIREELG